MKRSFSWSSLFIGALAGGAVGLGLWWWARRSMEAGFTTSAEQLASQLVGGSARLQAELAQGRSEMTAAIAQQVRAQVPPAVAAQLHTTLSQYGISPETGQRLSTVLDAAHRAGLV